MYAVIRLLRRLRAPRNDVTVLVIASEAKQSIHIGRYFNTNNGSSHNIIKEETSVMPALTGSSYLFDKQPYRI